MSAPPATTVPPPGARAPLGPAVLLVLVAGAFLPLAHLPSFDTVKLAVLTLGAAVLAWRASRRRDPGAPETLLRDPLLLLPLGAAAACAAGALAAWPGGSLVGPATVIASLVAARLAADGPSPGAALQRTLRAAAIASVGVGAYALLQAAGLDPAPWGERREVVSTLGNTSFAAEWQAAALPLSAMLLARGNRPRDRALGAAAVLLGAVHLVLARSRIDFSAAGAAAAVLAIVLLPRGRTRTSVIAAAVVAAVVAGGLFVAAGTGATSLVGRSDTVAIRLRIWEGAVRAFLAAPLRLGGTPFVEAYPPFRAPEEYLASLGRDVDTPHCDLLEVAVTAGLVGLVVAAAVLVFFVRRLAAIAERDRPAAAAIAASAAALLVSGLASSPMTHPATALLGAMLLAHAASFAPRPLPLASLRARGTDLALACAALAAFWPGPALRALRSDGFLALGRADREAGRATGALTLLDAATAADPLAFAARFELGTALLHARRTEEAVEALRSAHAIRPVDPSCRTNLVYALRAAGRADEAAALLDESLRAIPWHPLLLTARASSALERGDADAALADLDRAFPLMEAFDLRPRALRADALLARRADEDSRREAIDTLTLLHRRGDRRTLRRAAAAYARRDPLFLAVLGTCVTRIADTDPELATALALAPVPESGDADPGYLDVVARLLRRTGHGEEAARLTGRADGVRAREALAAGDLANALRLAKSAGTRAPSADHHVLEALCLARYGERAAVREALAAAIAAGPVDAAALRADPALSRLLPDPEIERSLDRAVAPAERGGLDIGGAAAPAQPPLSSGADGVRR